jgi:hypothetical protein
MAARGLIRRELGLLAPAGKRHLYFLIDAFWEDDGKMFTNRRPVQVLVTRLASGCSALGWLHEAEVLFIVLRTTLKANPVLSHGITQIAVQYCLRLEREKRYGEILSVLYDTYRDLSNIYDMDGKWERVLSVPAELHPHLLTMRDIMNDIPRPLNQHISPDNVNQLSTLVNYSTKKFGVLNAKKMRTGAKLQ